jgi:hypothetical protein
MLDAIVIAFLFLNALCVARQKSAVPDLGCSWQALSTVDVDRFQFDFANGECCQW